MYSAIYCVVLLLSLQCGSIAGDPTVSTNDWQITGKRFQFQAKGSDFEVDAYLGIPYAEAPVGSLRFKPPVPKGLKGDINAQNYGNSCPQIVPPFFDFFNTSNTGENCLFVNVYVPTPVSTNRAVMFWIHGGGYSMGAGSFENAETYPMASLGDVILVSINYRLGALGFLSTGDDVVPGNMGMLDQVETMKWVQKYISAFGGDPSRVTIFSESAGSASVSLHTLSPLSRGLFSGAIMQSGALPVDWGALEDPENYSKRAFGLGKLVGCEDNEDTQVLLDCLLEIPADAIVNASLRMMEVFPEDPEMFPHAPVYDQHFLPERPAALIEKGAYNPDINIMIGYNADEGTTTVCVFYPDAVEKPHLNATDFDNFLTFFAKLNLTPLQRDALELVYFDDAMLTEPDPNYFDAYVNIMQDIMFSCSSDTYLRAAAQANVGSVYAYMLNHHPSASLFNTPWSGSTHGDDLVFFGVHFTINKYDLTDEEVEMTLRMIQYWTNFAKTGNPNFGSENEESSTPAERLLEWPQYTLDRRVFKELSPSMMNIPDPSGVSCKLWNEFFPKLNAALESNEHCESKRTKDEL